jgi:hypothetical protein
VGLKPTAATKILDAPIVTVNGITGRNGKSTNVRVMNGPRGQNHSGKGTGRCLCSCRYIPARPCQTAQPVTRNAASLDWQPRTSLSLTLLQLAACITVSLPPSLPPFFSFALVLIVPCLRALQPPHLVFSLLSLFLLFPLFSFKFFLGEFPLFTLALSICWLFWSSLF